MFNASFIMLHFDNNSTRQDRNDRMLIKIQWPKRFELKITHAVRVIQPKATAKKLLRSATERNVHKHRACLLPKLEWLHGRLNGCVNLPWNSTAPWAKG